MKKMFVVLLAFLASVTSVNAFQEVEIPLPVSEPAIQDGVSEIRTGLGFFCVDLESAEKYLKSASAAGVVLASDAENASCVHDVRTAAGIFPKDPSDNQIVAVRLLDSKDPIAIRYLIVGR